MSRHVVLRTLCRIALMLSQGSRIGWFYMAVCVPAIANLNTEASTDHFDRMVVLGSSVVSSPMYVAEIFYHLLANHPILIVTGRFIYPRPWVCPMEDHLPTSGGACYCCGGGCPLVYAGFSCKCNALDQGGTDRGHRAYP